MGTKAKSVALLAVFFSACPPVEAPPPEGELGVEVQTVDCDQSLGSRANRYFVDAQNPQRMAAASDDRWFFSSTGGAKWKSMYVDTTSPLEGPFFAGNSLYFRAVLSDGVSRWFASADDGATFTEITLASRSGTNAPPGTRFHGSFGFTLEGRALFTPDDGATFVALDGNEANGVTTFVSNGVLFVSADQGITYERPTIPPQPREVHVLADGRLLLNAFAEDGSDEFTLFLSENRGESWKRIGPSHYPSHHIRHFAVGPGEQEIWAEYEVSINEPLRVIHTIDLGVTWKYVDFKAGDTTLVPDGSEITFTRVGAQVQFGFSVKESKTLRAFPRCVTGTGSLSPRSTPNANGWPWASLRSGSLRAVPAAGIGEAFSVRRNDGVQGALSGPLAGGAIEYPEFWLTNIDVARGVGGALHVLMLPHAYAALNGSAFGVMSLDTQTGAVDEANVVPLAKLGSATMTNRQFNWRAERLYVFADASQWVEAAIDEPTLNVRGRAVVPLQGAPARAASYRVRSPDQIWVANPFVDEQDFRIPLRAAAGLVGLVPLDCVNSTCLSLPNGERAVAVYLSSKYFFVQARSGLYATELTSPTQLTRVMEAPLAMVSASVVPDDEAGALYFVDGDLWRFVPDFSRVAARPE